MPQNYSDFNLPRNAYTAFDATSLKSLIKQRLSENTVFTGQNYEASNMSGLIDVIAYSYHVLLFYLNQTATESMFSEAELYENMNRIVKTIDYKPVGYQSSILTFEATGTASLPANTYTIPRYTFFNVGGIHFTVNADITFTKTVDTESKLTDLSTNNLLYQGRFREYPIVTAIGEDFETVVLVPGDNIIIDHFNIDVYVKDVDTGKWSEWERTTSLYLEKSVARKYEVRLNEHKRYELKFGNDNTGKKLKTGDEIAIYYLQSSGSQGQVGPKVINRSKLSKYEAPQFITIFNDIKDDNIKYMTQEQMLHMSFANANGSSEYYEGENVDDIRNNAPKLFGTQYRLVTKDDYEAYIKQNYNNMIRDIKVVNNWDYVDGHMKYNLETIGTTKNNNEPRTLLNQVNFADACDFNNVYCYVLPRIKQTTTNNPRANYLTPAQKSAILSGLRDKKTLGAEIIIADPVFVAVDMLTYDPNKEDLTPDLASVSELKIVRSNQSSKSFESIKTKAYKIITDYFDNFEFGGTLDVSLLQNKIFEIGDIAAIYTRRTDTGQETQGIGLAVWNPIYPNDDIISTGSGLPMPYYKHPYLYQPTKFGNKITVVSESSLSELSTSEY